MVGTSLLVCREFSESEEFEKSFNELLDASELTEEQVYDRIDAVEWALARGDNDEEAWVRQVPGRNLWAVVIPRGIPPLVLYARRCSAEHSCQWLWIEERL